MHAKPGMLFDRFLAERGDSGQLQTFAELEGLRGRRAERKKHLQWAARDSNLRLPPCEDGTLTAELAAREAIDALSGEAEIATIKNSDSHPRRQDG